MHKGWAAGATLAHADRLLSPLVRTADHTFTTATWDTALDGIARAFAAIQQKHGRNAVGVFGGGSLTNEGLPSQQVRPRRARTANIDYNGRFCMSSAAALTSRRSVLDRGLPFPRGHRARRRHLARRRERGRNDAADSSILRSAAGQRRCADRRRPAANANGSVGLASCN